MAKAQAAGTVGARLDVRSGARYWTVPVIRAALALIPAAVITFTADHAAQFGLLVFGAFALAGGLLLAGLSWRTLGDPRERMLFAVQGAVGVVAGALALALNGGGLGFFLYLVSVWAAVTGFLELYSGVRVRGRSASSRDWMLVGGLTAGLSLAFLLLPPNAVVAVGLFGAYLVILGVYLVIAGLSLKWAPTDEPAPASVPNDLDPS
ncbi:Uncharacterized membrane protein HdeD, DUF308 family [Cryobacterium psychrotolerans]|uniref:Uncharacterized membrane protein HdeD, DUF308 family n=1 Tax=Cryobacterium psychrotolerans TaxID=386301 RepID=A0A1G9BGS1_9MICO|nr:MULTISPECIES: hypothetical protein [Cryobacterium]SDK38716.1 Uncharacterized membrane protein HdeD, DUF308 family [Cryobacterium psychrotolerans]